MHFHFRSVLVHLSRKYLPISRLKKKYKMTLYHKQVFCDHNKKTLDCWVIACESDLYIKWDELLNFFIYDSGIDLKIDELECDYTYILKLKELVEKIPYNTLHQSYSVYGWNDETMFIRESGLFRVLYAEPELMEFLYKVMFIIRKHVYPIVMDEYFNAAKYYALDNMQDYGYIYVATNKLLAEKGIYKISGTTDLERTLFELNSSSPFKWEVLFKHSVKVRRFILERSIHKFFINKHMNRDFYTFDKSIDVLDEVRSYFKLNKFDEMGVDDSFVNN